MSDALIERIAKPEAAQQRLSEANNAYAYELRKLGIVNGSRGVFGGFIPVGGVFLVNALFRWATSNELLSANQFLGLAAIATVGLLAYSVHIRLYASARGRREEEASARAHPSSRWLLSGSIEGLVIAESSRKSL